MKFDVGKTEIFVKISSSNSEGGLWGALDSDSNENREAGSSQLPCHISLLFGVPKAIRTPVTGVKVTLCTLTVPSRMNSVRSGVHPAIADAILGHGDKKKSPQNLYLTFSDDDLIGAVDMVKFDICGTKIRVKK